METQLILVGTLVLVVGIAFNAWLMYMQLFLKKESEKYRDEAKILQDQAIKLLNENEITLRRLQLERAKIYKHDESERKIMEFKADPYLNWVIENKSRFLSMTYDQFLDWLDAGETSYIQDAIPYFEQCEMHNQVRIMKIYLNRK